jgi:hypothetical protein
MEAVMGLRVLPNLGGRLVGTTVAESLEAADSLRRRRYSEYLDFYEGKHWIRARNGRSTLVVNLARAIVDKGVSYLLGRGIGYAVRGEEQGLSGEAAARAERLLYLCHELCELDVVDQAAALNAAILGDGVWKVLWDPDEQRPRVVNVDPLGFYPRWSADDAERLWRVDLVYGISADEAEALYGPSAGGGRPAADTVKVLERWTARELEVQLDGTVHRKGANPYGFIPLVHVANLPQPNEHWGVSDLRDVVSLNRAYNERLSDQADTIRYHADPPVIFKGVSEHTDLGIGPGTVWDIPADASVELLEWKGTAPAVEAHLGRLLQAITDVSETPRTAFGDSGRILSGVALETELRPLIQRSLRKRIGWTAALRRRNALLLRLCERFGFEGAQPGEFAPYRTTIVWPPMLPKDDEVEVRNQVALVEAGLRSRRTAMDALGTEDPDAELRRMEGERATDSCEE